MYLFFDTETNGLPKNFKAPATDLDNWPRVIQLAWQLYDEDENLISENCTLIKPDGWTVPEDSEFHKEHGYTNENLQENGVELKGVLQKFVEDIDKSKYMIAHNMDFDRNVVSAELIRYSVRPNVKPEKVCTMKESTNFCKIPNTSRWGGYKWPTLIELHQKLFDEGFDGAHDALEDVRACAKSFFELKKREVILK